MGRTEQTFYSDLFAQLQSIQDALADKFGICLVLVDGNGREKTVPSGLPLLCNDLEGAHSDCAAFRSSLIEQARHTGRTVVATCPQGLCVAGFSTSVATHSGHLYLVAGRTSEERRLQEHLSLLEGLYSLPIKSPITGKPPSGEQAKESQAEIQSRLTTQECRVLSCIAAGLSNKEIAATLFISQSTVKSHVANILRKLGLSNRTEASVYALRNGLGVNDDNT